jgi:uncharacterized membrane-anchored protein
MRLFAISCLQFVVSLTPALVRADEPPTAPEAASAEQDSAAQLEASLRFKTGDVAVGDNLATLHLGESLRFLGGEDAEKVLVAWGNPPGSGALGMVLPQQLSPFADDAWAVLVTYSEEGHVDDEEAKEIDFAELLSDMKKDAEESNDARKSQGFGAVHLVGWAEPPHYDAAAKKLYWAKELDFGAPAHTLNYDIRVLGRKGVLELSAIAGINQLAMIKAEMPRVLSGVEFNSGNRYADFDPGVDKMAAYGIGALIAGKVAAKAGLFKVVLAALLASKKLIVAGAVGVGMFLKKLFGKKGAQPETPPEAPAA